MKRRLLLLLSLAFSIPQSGFSQTTPATPAPPVGGVGTAVTAPVESELAEPPAPPAPISTPNVMDYKKFRDPFLEPLPPKVDTEKRSDLELFASTEFKLTGVITGPFRMRAVLVSPKGKSYIVHDGMPIGLRSGKIVRITTKSVVIEESLVNELGELEKSEMELTLEAEK